MSTSCKRRTKMTIKYRGFLIDHICPPIPIRSCDWAYQHEAFDGAPDSGDGRFGTDGSLEECKQRIDEFWEAENDS